MRLSIPALSFLLGATALAAPQSLKLTISAENTSVSEPSPLELTLHFFNAGSRTFWLYRPVRPVQLFHGPNELTPDVEEAGAGQADGGSTLEVAVVSAGAGGNEALPTGEVLVPAEAWRPQLIRLSPGGEDEERVLVHIAPPEAAGQGGLSPGVYKLIVTYRAWYANTEQIERVLGVDLWHAEARSNTLAISIEPSKGTGAVSGIITDSKGDSAPAVLVSVSDRQERTLGQMLTNYSGQYKFDGLPWGFYWITARPLESTASQAVFQHVVLSANSTSASADLMLLPFTPYEPKQLVHKPVLVRVDDIHGDPEGGVRLQSTFSNGSVVQNVKADTAADGVAELEVIPGGNFLSLAKDGCSKEDRRMDVAPGGGVAAFRFVLACSKR